MILYVEHGFNASTFAARVVTSTQSDIYSAVTGVIGALKGALHGGANEAVMHDMIEIGDSRNAREWLRGKLARKEKVMGFDIACFTPIFVMSRITGWTAHIMEQAASNSLIRPLSAYSGREHRALAGGQA